MLHVIHDHLLVRGGAERLVLCMANGLGAPLITGFKTKELSGWGEDANIHALGSAVEGRMMRYIATARRFSHIAPALLSQEANIYSGVLAPFAVVRQAAGRRIHYCHSPPRFIYDLKSFYLSQMGPGGRLGLQLFDAWYRPRYEAAIRDMDLVIANSQNVARRLKRYLNIDATVIPPPIDTERFTWIESGNFFLSLARLEDYKRVDLIIKAFRRMPTQNLIVGSGGSKEAELKQLAEGCSNIRFTSWQSDSQLAELLGSCRAAIYIPQEEDFGMSPLEAMAAGKPVIGVSEGGLLETIIDGVTGTLLPSPPEVDDIVAAVQKLGQQASIDMRSACTARAQEFSRRKFIERMQETFS